jgi:hypothetical protein
VEVSGQLHAQAALLPGKEKQMNAKDTRSKFRRHLVIELADVLWRGSFQNGK